jgi:hypothetical protein
MLFELGRTMPKSKNANNANASATIPHFGWRQKKRMMLLINKAPNEKRPPKKIAH